MVCVNLSVANQISNQQENLIADAFQYFEMHLLIICLGGTMKYILKNRIQIDCFSDGEMVVYDQANGITHVLNITAALILNLIAEEKENPFESFVKRIHKENDTIPIAKLKKDYQNIVKAFIEANIVVVR